MSDCVICRESKRRLFVDEDLRSGLEHSVIATRRHFSKSAIGVHASHIHIIPGIAAEVPREQAPIQALAVMDEPRDDSPLDVLRVALPHVRRAFQLAGRNPSMQREMLDQLNDTVAMFLCHEDMGLP